MALLSIRPLGLVAGKPTVESAEGSAGFGRHVDEPLALSPHPAFGEERAEGRDPGSPLAAVIVALIVGERSVHSLLFGRVRRKRQSEYQNEESKGRL